MPIKDRVHTRSLVPWWALLCLIAFVQSPGRTVADTKHDLTENPSSFLANAFSMWSDNLTFGQLQNQSYGYLFPQGPFFAFFDLFPDWLVPDWVTQALWWSLTLCLAFTGLYRLAEATGIGTHYSRIAASLVFAFSPRMITTLGAISSESWPFALAPWIALPLVRVCLTPPDTSRSQYHAPLSQPSIPNAPPSTKELVRAVLLSGLAVLCTGAVNAVSTAAACIPAGLVVLTSALGGRSITGKQGINRRQAWVVLVGWLVACLAASLWWIIPLLMLGGYAAPFTDYIESSGVTTRWMSLVEILRGTTSWTPFVSTERAGGHALVSEPIFIYATLAVAAIGLLGLAMRAMPHRRLWFGMALLGVIIMAAWTEPFSPVWEQARVLLDASLAPLRNLHKFDVLLRLPLALGFAHATAALPWRVDKRWLHPERHPSIVASALVMVTLLAAIAPAWSARLAPQGSFKEVPQYWAQAANWINAHGADTRTLVLPSSPFADQTWGNTRDEPIQPLADVPWAVRDAIPLVPPEAIRSLDGLRDSLTVGREVPALDATLRNSGIGFLLVRKDLRLAYRADNLQKLEKTLHSSKGLKKLAEFGDDKQTQIEIWGAGSGDNAQALREHAGAARIINQDQIPLVTGGPEVLTRLDDIDRDSPVRMIARSGAGTVTDTPARRGRNYGEVNKAVSGILADGENTNARNLVPDYPVDGVPLMQTLTGRTEISVSSSASEPYNIGGADSEHSVNALVDGDKNTWWEPLSGTGQAEWVKLHLPEPARNTTLTLTGAKVPARVQITTGGAFPFSTSVNLTPGEPQKIPLNGKVSDVNITARVAPVGFAIAELKLSGSVGADSEHTEDLTPVRLPAVPNSSPLVKRWAFGQEISEGTLTRLFTVPETQQVTVDADTCRTGLKDPWATLRTADGGEERQLRCNEELTLTKGNWILEAQSRWVSLTGTDFYAPSASEQNVLPASLDQQISPTNQNRVIWVPSSVNKGRELRLGDTLLQPVTINGWQQGWMIPAGASGQLNYTYAPAATWRNGIVLGGAIATVYALIAVVFGVFLPRASRRRTPPLPHDSAEVEAALPEQIAPASANPEQVMSAQVATDQIKPNQTAIAAVAPRLGSVFILLLTLLTVGLSASWPGVLIIGLLSGLAYLARAALGSGRARKGLLVTMAISMVFGAWQLAGAPWPSPDYAGESWLLQLTMVVAISCCALLTIDVQALPPARMKPLP